MLDLELVALANAMQGNGTDRVVALPSACWSDPRTQVLARAIKQAHNEGRADEVGVAQALGEGTDDYKLIGGLPKLLSLTSHYGGGRTAFDELHEAAELRQTNAAIEAAMAASSQALSPTDAKDAAIAALLSIETGGKSESTPTSLGDSLATVMEQSRQAYLDPTSEHGVTTGFENLDWILGQWQPGAVYILGAGTGRGKSVMALNFAMAAAKSNHGVLYISLEMGHADLTRRLVAAEARVPPDAIRSGRLNHDQIDAMRHASTALELIGNNLMIMDNVHVDAERLSAIVKTAQAARSIDLVIVDYLQLLKCEATYSREREVASISAGLLAVSRQCEVPVIALSQLNDQGMVRESRSVEHDASAVLRIDYEDDAWIPGSSGVDCHLRVLKNRHGRTGSVSLTFERRHQRFIERVYE